MRQSNIIKLTHGGRRPGAGRPKNPDSLRSRLAEAEAEGADGWFTLYEVWRDEYISKHGHFLVRWLRSRLPAMDLPTTARVNRKYFLGPSQALRLAGLAKELQPECLVAWHRGILEKVVATYRIPHYTSPQLTEADQGAIATFRILLGLPEESPTTA